VQDDSPSVQVSKEMYTLDTGIPSVRAYQAVTRLMGEFSFVLHSYAPFPNYIGAGGTAPITIPATLYGGYATVLTIQSRTVIGVNTITADMQPNCMIVVDTSVSILSSGNTGWITSVNTSSKYITLSGPDGLKRIDIAVGNPLVAISRSQQLLGGSGMPRFHILGVADFFDGGQVVHDMPFAQPRGNWAEALRAGQDPRVQCTFDLLGYTVSTPYSTSGQVSILERHWFPPTTIA